MCRLHRCKRQWREIKAREGDARSVRGRPLRRGNRIALGIVVAIVPGIECKVQGAWEGVLAFASGLLLCTRPCAAGLHLRN